MKKKLLCMVLVLILALCLFALPVSAETEEEVVSGSCGPELTWTLEDGVLTISGTGAASSYDQGRMPWKGLDFTEVVIEEGVTRMMSYAFSEFEKLEKVTIPQSMENISYKMFYRCKNLKEVQIPSSGITRIGEQAFYCCESLESFSIPDTVTEIGREAFMATGLTEAVLPEGLQKVGGYAFSGTKITSVHIPATLKELEMDVFSGCIKLTTVTFSEGVEKILQDAFSYCTSLEAITLPEGVTTIGANAFSNCTSLKEIGLPTTLRSIGTQAFYKTAITSFVLPEGLETLYQTFKDMESLESVTLPSTLKSMGWGTFQNCSNLTEIILPDGLETIGEYCFWRSGIQSVVIPDSVTKIKYSAFRDCWDLTFAKLPDNPATQYEGDMFHGCRSLSAIEIPESMTEIPPNFLNYTSISSIELHEGIVSIGYDAFRGTCLTEIVFPSTLKMIGDSAFSGCASLTTVVFPEGLSEIGMHAFRGSGLTSVELPAGLTRLGKYAFNECPELTRAVMSPNPDTVYDGSVFVDCPKLTEIVLTEGMKKIPVELAKNTGLESIEIPDSIVTIGGSAFYGTKIAELVIPASVEVIAPYAFWDCDNLTHVEIPYSVCVADSDIFAYCDNLSLSVYDGTAGYYYAEESGIPYTVLPGPGPEAYHAIMLDVSKNGSVSVSAKHAHQGQIITITAQPDEGCSLISLVLYYDALEEKNLYIQQISDTTFTFVMPDCTVLAEIVFLNPELPYVDVDPKAYYYVPVLWAHTFEITAGVDATHFGPNNACTRAQVVTFLWRAAGCPEPTATEHPFVDIQEGSYYYKAVLWAVENGITAGVDATHFGPNQGCTRAQVATFLWRACGQPEPLTQENPFRDTNPNSYYYKAVLWAVENGITAGTGNNRFSPDNICTRGQIVSFLYRTFYG